MESEDQTTSSSARPMSTAAPELGLVLDEASSDSEALEMVLCYVPDAELQILEQVKTLARELSAFGLMALSLSAKSAAVMGDPNCIGCSLGCGIEG
jgi:hypothetical protein